VVAASPDNVTLGVPSKFNRDLLGERPMLQIIADAIFEVSGARPTVQCVVAAASADSERTRGATEASGFMLAESVLGAELF